MSNSKNITYIIELLQQNKYKKAQLLVKKLNSKPSQQTYQSVKIEADCYLKANNFKMAKITYNNAIKKAKTNAEKIDIIRQLRNINIELNELSEVCRYLKQELELDSSLQNASIRSKLTQYCFEIGDFEEAEYQAIKLLSREDFYIEALFYLINIYSEIGNKYEALKYLNKALLEADSLTFDYLNILVNKFVSNGDSAKAESIINKYHHIYPLLEGDTSTSDKTTEVRQSKNIVYQKLDQQRSHVNIEKMISCETKNTSIYIKKLVKTLVKEGAYFHKKMRIIEKSGNLSVYADGKSSKFEPFIDIPLNCMPLITDYQFSIDSKSNLKVQSNKTQINKRAYPIMKLMVDIYNATNKLSDWSKLFPFITLKEHPQLLDLLIGEKPFNEKVAFYQKLFNDGQWEQLLIRSFIGSREFIFTKEMLAKSGLITTRKGETGLLGVIDFLNHKVGAPSLNYEEKSSSMSVNVEFTEGFSETFIEYNLSDPLISYLMYGYIDTSGKLIYSIPVTCHLKFGNSKLLVFNAPSETKDKLNNKTSHLRKFLPENIKSNGRNIAVSSICIPNTEHYGNFKQVLSYILLKYNLGGYYSDEVKLNLEIKNLETQIIDLNLKHWNNLKISVGKAYNSTNQFSEITYRDINFLCDYNINHLKKYQ